MPQNQLNGVDPFEERVERIQTDRDIDEIDYDDGDESFLGVIRPRLEPRIKHRKK